MSIIQEIKDAVESIKYDVVCGCGDINTSVVKHASGLSNDGIQRVIEEVNVANFLDLLKSGEDKSKHFPLADPQLVFKKVAGDALKKTDLMTDEEDEPSLEFYEKEASANARTYSLPVEAAPPVDISGQSIDYILAKQDVMIKRAEVYRDAASECEDIIMDSMNKVADTVMNNPYKAMRLSIDCMKAHGTRVNTVLPSIFKLANLNPDQIQCGNFEDDDFAMYNDTEDVGYIGVIVDALDKRASLSDLHREEGAKVDRVKDWLKKKAVKRDYSLARPGTVSGMSDPGADSIRKSFYNRKDDQAYADAAESYADTEIATAKSEKSKAFGEGMTNISKGISEKGQRVAQGIKGIVDTIRTPSGLGQKVKSLVGMATNMAPTAEAMDVEIEAEEAIGDKFSMAIKQKKVIEDLMDNDEMLREQDPMVIANLYKTLVDIAPHVSTKPEIVRSFLRQVSAQAEPTIDPMYATILMKLDKSLSGDQHALRLD